MKQEYIYQLIALAIYFVSMLFSIDHNRLEFEGQPFDFLGLALYHGLLFIFVNYVLIPKFFNKKKLLIFLFLLFASVAVFTIIEETVIEQLLFNKSRGNDPLDILDLYFFIGEVGIPLLVFIIIKLLFDSIENQKRLANIEKNSLQNELKFLRSQIQPHVLFNSLNNLYEYTLAKSEMAPDLVLQLSKVLRYVLYETDREYIQLKKEIQFLEDYIGLQKTQLENRGKVDFNLEWKDSEEELLIAPFVLIPFIENSFKHSLNSQENGIAIRIDIKIQEHRLEMVVSNTYEHFSKTATDLTESGIGLKNVKKRLNLLYPTKHSLEITKKNANYIVKLVLTLTS